MSDSDMRKAVALSTHQTSSDGRTVLSIRIRPGGVVTVGHTLDLKRGTALMLDKLIIGGDPNRWAILDLQIDGEYQPVPCSFLHVRPAKRRIDLGVRYIGTDVEGEVFNGVFTAALIACHDEDGAP